MGSKYDAMRSTGAREFHKVWADATTPVFVTEEFPGTIAGKLLGDVVDGFPDVTALRDLLGNPIRLPAYNVHSTDIVVLSNSYGQFEKRISQEPTQLDEVTCNSNFDDTFAGSDVQLQKNNHVWEVVDFHLESAAAVAYSFIDEDDNVVFGPMYLAVNRFRNLDTPFRCAVGDRLRIKASGAGAGSLTLWAVRAV